MGRRLFLIFRIACYIALLVLVGSVVALMLAMSFGNCTQSGDSIACTSSLAQVAANTANITLFIASFTLIALLLALGGIFFLSRPWCECSDMAEVLVFDKAGEHSTHYCR